MSDRLCPVKHCSNSGDYWDGKLPDCRHQAPDSGGRPRTTRTKSGLKHIQSWSLMWPLADPGRGNVYRLRLAYYSWEGLRANYDPPRPRGVAKGGGRGGAGKGRGQGRRRKGGVGQVRQPDGTAGRSKNAHQRVRVLSGTRKRAPRGARQWKSRGRAARGTHSPDGRAPSGAPCGRPEASGRGPMRASSAHSEAPVDSHGQTPAGTTARRRRRPP